MSPADLKLLVIALIAIATLVLLVTRFKVNAFISLMLASLRPRRGSCFSSCSMSHCE